MSRNYLRITNRNCSRASSRWRKKKERLWNCSLFRASIPSMQSCTRLLDCRPLVSSPASLLAWIPKNLRVGSGNRGSTFRSHAIRFLSRSFRRTVRRSSSTSVRILRVYGRKISIGSMASGWISARNSAPNSIIATWWASRCSGWCARCKAAGRVRFFTISQTRYGGIRKRRREDSPRITRIKDLLLTAFPQRLPWRIPSRPRLIHNDGFHAPHRVRPQPSEVPDDFQNHSHLFRMLVLDKPVQLRRVDAFVRTRVIEIVKGVSLRRSLRHVGLITRAEFAEFFRVGKQADRRPVHNNPDKQGAEECRPVVIAPNPRQKTEIAANDDQSDRKEYKVVQTERCDISHQDGDQDQE